jgi:hypothetical protein
VHAGRSRRARSADRSPTRPRTRSGFSRRPLRERAGASAGRCRRCSRPGGGPLPQGSRVRRVAAFPSASSRVRAWRTSLTVV